jgi:putative inorganic carbon (hco3(-)) transporter
VALAVRSDVWTQRMLTIADYGNESSALSRIGVWRWTLEFAAGNPLGGGFDAYRINHTTMPVEGQPGAVLDIRARAFHSIYFEVLGEHGIPGLAIYLAVLGATFLNFRTVTTGTDWIARLGAGLRQSTIIYLTCGLFIGIAFQPYMYYMVGVSIALCEARRRSLRATKVPGRFAYDARFSPPTPIRWGEAERAVLDKDVAHHRS